MTISPTADRHLKDLARSGDNKLIEKKLFTFADAASATESGPLDESGCHLKGLAADLKPVRRRRIGHHRVFFAGYHTQCLYWTFYIKKHKKKGVDDELDPAFQDKLRAALGDTAQPRLMSKPKP
ncbi:MAG: hypothetical protein AABN34_28100 [Acidobacteriota bacterium]